MSREPGARLPSLRALLAATLLILLGYAALTALPPQHPTPPTTHRSPS